MMKFVLAMKFNLLCTTNNNNIPIYLKYNISKFLIIFRIKCIQVEDIILFY